MAYGTFSMSDRLTIQTDSKRASPSNFYAPFTRTAHFIEPQLSLDELIIDFPLLVFPFFYVLIFTVCNWIKLSSSLKNEAEKAAEPAGHLNRSSPPFSICLWSCL